MPPDPADPATAPAPLDARSRLLVIDDQAAVRDLLSRLLTRHGFAVTTTADVATGLRHLEAGGCDGLLLDVYLREANGLEVLRQLRQRWPADVLPVILITADTESELVVAGLDAGANDFIVKPIQPRVLTARVDACLRLKHLADDRRRAEESLRTSEMRLERRVAERTAELASANDVLRQEIAERQRATEAMLTYQQRLRALTAELAKAEERERRRIARGLHDDIGHALAMAKIKLAGMDDPPADPAAASAAVAETRQFLDQAISQLRTLTFELGSRVLYDFGLEAAVENLLEGLPRHGLAVAFHDDEVPKPLAEEAQVSLLQGTRELLHNIVKHAGAGHVSVAIRREGDEVRVTVEDDGRGFDPTRLTAGPTREGGFGLFGIRERMDYLGGRLTIEPRSGGGTRAELAVPLLAAGCPTNRQGDTETRRQGEEDPGTDRPA